MGSDYKNTLDALRGESQKLLRERDRLAETVARIDQRIEVLRAAEEALAKVEAAPEPEPTQGQEVEPKFEITAGMREILRDAALEHRSLSAPEIRDHLVARGWEPKGANPLAVVHTILKRLDDIEAAQTPTGKRYIDRKTSAQQYATESEQCDREEAQAAEREAALQRQRIELRAKCVEVVRATPGGITVHQICRAVQADGFDMSQWKAPTKAIAVTLRHSPDIGTFRSKADDIPTTYYATKEWIEKKRQAMKSAKQ